VSRQGEVRIEAVPHSSEESLYGLSAPRERERGKLILAAGQFPRVSMSRVWARSIL
jgi:hypothetical protein